jgi:tetratricopeptide (TPR) repeat protein
MHLSPRHLVPGLAALGLLAACAGEEPSPEPAVPALEEIPITTSSAAALADFRAGQAALDVGRRRQANALFRSAAEKDPDFAYAYLNAANSAASAREFKEYLDLAAEHLAGKSEGERLLVEINRTFFDNDAERRIRLAETLVEKYPRSPRAWLTLGFMQGGLNRNEAARDSMEKALELDPEMIAAHVALGYSYVFNEPKDFELARESMERCVELDPDEAKAYENLGDVHRALGELDKAREYYILATEKDPELSVAHLKRGHISSFLGDFDDARLAYDLGVEGARGVDRANYANYRAFTHLHRDDPESALAELGELLESIDGMEIPQNQVAGAKIFTSANQAAIALHHRLFDRAREILAARAAVMRDNAEAIGDPGFRRLREADILLWEGRLAARRGDYEAAEAKAEAHRELLEGDANPRRFEGYHGLRGLIALERRSYAEAVEHLRQANLTDVYVKYHLALAEEGAGNAAAAKRLFAEVAAWNFNSVGFALVRRDALERTG